MKKNVYITPAMICMVVEAEELIAASKNVGISTVEVTDEYGFAVRERQDSDDPTSDMDEEEW